MTNFVNSKWDPDDPTDSEVTSPPSPSCIRRIKNDISDIYSEPPPGLCVLPDPNNITIIHALLTGPFDTPYEGGFFYFLIRFPAEYPISPPRVRLMTTGNGTVRFNPNLYKYGKVCLSILGTWEGPSWSPALTLSTVLISIQSLMNEKPYHNEPGYEHERTSGDSKHYNTIIQHETIRVAVCDMIEGNINIPDTLRYFTWEDGECGTDESVNYDIKYFRAVMESSFLDYYKYYVQVCKSHLRLDGTDMKDPFGDTRPKFDFKSSLKRLKSIKARLDNNATTELENNDEDDNKSRDTEADADNTLRKIEAMCPKSEDDSTRLWGSGLKTCNVL